MSHRTSSGSDFFNQDLEDAEGTLVLHRVPDLDEAESKGRTPPDSAPPPPLNRRDAEEVMR
jgi:hypothetical protein